MTPENNPSSFDQLIAATEACKKADDDYVRLFAECFIRVCDKKDLPLGSCCKIKMNWRKVAVGEEYQSKTSIFKRIK